MGARHWDSQTPPGTLRAEAAPVSIRSSGSLVFHPEHPVTMASHSLCWALVSHQHAGGGVDAVILWFLVSPMGARVPFP